jgi:hypothetical protein
MVATMGCLQDLYFLNTYFRVDQLFIVNAWILAENTIHYPLIPKTSDRKQQILKEKQLPNKLIKPSDRVLLF